RGVGRSHGLGRSEDEEDGDGARIDGERVTLHGHGRDTHRVEELPECRGAAASLVVHRRRTGWAAARTQRECRQAESNDEEHERDAVEREYPPQPLHGPTRITNKRPRPDEATPGSRNPHHARTSTSTR